MLAESPELQQKLRAGIDAAKAGETLVARRLLSEVVRADGRNELAWIWLATVLSEPSERILALKRVLALNPNNTRAREALMQLENTAEKQTVQPSEPALAARLAANARPVVTTRPLPSDEPETQRQAGLPPAFFLFTGIILLVVVGISFALLSGGGEAVATPTETPGSVVSNRPTATPTATETPTATPTLTPIPAELVTRFAPTLPPTLTPTATATLTPSPQVTPTLSLASFDLLYLSQDLARAEPDAFVISANGENEGLLAEKLRDASYAPDAFTIAFVRDIYDETGAIIAVELFTTTLANPDEVVQITTLGAMDTSGPVWSSDGTQIVFSSSGGGDNPDLWLVTLGGTPVRLEETSLPERSPALSPDGTRLAFTRDADLNGFTEIYLATIDLASAQLSDVTEATETSGSSYAPTWSPDGLRIVFASDRTGDGDIYIMDADGFNEQVLTVDGGSAEDRNPKFSPDGLWIAFISNAQDDRFQTYLMTVRGTELQRLTNNPRNDISVSFKPVLP